MTRYGITGTGKKRHPIKDYEGSWLTDCGATATPVRQNPITRFEQEAAKWPICKRCRP